jgi:signal transduction histidine kinase
LAQERRNRIFLLALSILMLALAVFVFLFFRSRTRSTQRIAEQQKLIHLQETEHLKKEKKVAELTASLETQEKERNRIARDLHDGIGSMMSGISAQVEHLRSRPGISEQLQTHLASLRELIKDASSELRRTSYELMPARLLREGLEPAIRDLCLSLLVKSAIEPVLEINADLTSLNPEHQLSLYRIIQELLNNIVKHAGASEVLIQFTKVDEGISLVIEDNGRGFDVEARKQDGGLGLGSLRNRVNLINGFLDLASTPGQGTTVTINFQDQIVSS